MDRQLRKRLGCRWAVAVSVTLWLLVPFLVACGAAAEPEVIVETVVVEQTSIVEKEGEEVTVVETIEVEVTPVVTQVAPTGAPGAAEPTEAPTARPTEPAPPTPSSPGAIVQKELARLASGLIAYNPPTEMTVDKPERVEVRISMDTTAPLTTGLKGAGTPTVESIHVSCFMKVRLVGESFEIVAFSSEEQIVPAQGYTEWAWDVTPTESGEKTLSLIVTALVKAPDAEGEKDLPIIERQIHVQVNPGFLFSSFVSDNRGWIYTAVLVPLVAALGRWLWQRQQWRRQPGDPGAGEDAPHT